MRIIHVAGTSGSGKTTFIAELIRHLAPIGKTAAVKHLGHHRYSLEQGRDTTRYYTEGAAIAVGVDAEKAVLVAADSDLDAVLSMLSDAGVEYAILEGFKTRSFPKIVIGDLAAENAVLHNPSVHEVMETLPRFHDYVTLSGLVADLRREYGTARGAVVTFRGSVGDEGGGKIECAHSPDTVDAGLVEIRREMERIPGIIGIRLHYAGAGITCIAVLAEDRAEAFRAVSRALERIKRELCHTN